MADKRKKKPCPACGGKKWLILKRSDGFWAVERCDNCAPVKLRDSQAAKFAIKEGVDCEPDYPCLLCEHPEWSKEEWRQEVQEDDTLLGYWEWVEHQLEANAND